MLADPSTHHDSGRPAGLQTARQRTAALLGVAVLAFGSARLAACGDEESAGPEPAGAASSGGAGAGADEREQGESGRPAEVALSELLENPGDHLGQTVTVSGQVADLDVHRDAASAAAFTIGEDVDADLLVLPTAEADIAAADITGDSVVRVQGVVREVNAALAAGGDFPFEQRDDAWLSDLTDEVAVAATRIETDVRRGDESGDDPAG